MTIMESAIAMNNDYIECTNAIGKIELFAEASYKEYEINLKEVALKVLQENGTEEDFDFLATEAANGYIERAKKAIEKIIEAVKKFIRTCKEKLLNLVTSTKTTAAVDKVEDVCKVNSKLRSTKVEYQNTDKHQGVLQQGIDRIRKRVAKVKAKGVATDEDINEITEIESDTMKKVAAISIVTVVTLGTAIAIFKLCNSKSEVEQELDENAVSDCEIAIRADETKTPVTAAFYTRASGLIAKLKKEKASKKIVKSTSLIDAIKSAISKLKSKTTSENLEDQVNESVLTELQMFSYVAESVESEETTNVEVSTETETVEMESVGVSEGLDLDSYFDNLCGELFADTTTESSENEDDDNIVSSSHAYSEGYGTVALGNPAHIEESAEQSDIEEDTQQETVTESSEESTDTDGPSLAELYMEQLESEVFGNEETVETESTQDEESEDLTVESLLNEMEQLL